MTKTKDFQFKQFIVRGGYSGMPVSTDGVLLGTWAPVKEIHSILDIGTGTGLLSLMCAQRNHELIIDAIDIDENAFQAAQINITSSPWENRITLHHANILTHHFNKKFDAIICNPPYFNNGPHSNTPSRAKARHTTYLDHSSLLRRCHSLLSSSGKAHFIFPLTEGHEFLDLISQNNWFVSEICYVQPTNTKPANRLLISIQKQPTHQSVTSLIIRENGHYSDDFTALTKDFYLKM